MQKKGREFVNMFLKSYTILSLFIILYTLYRILVYYFNGNDLQVIFGKYNKYLFISFSSFLFFLFSQRLNKYLKQYIVLVFTSILVTIYILEFTLAFTFPEKKGDQFRNLNLKDKLAIYQKFLEKNIYPFDVINKKFMNNGDFLYPLSYIPNIKTYLCNETGENIFYISDNFGFRNENLVWDKKNIEIVLIGDSFVHGACQKTENTIAGYLKKREDSVINLGLGGAGPLREYAIFKEFAKNIKPKNVFWFYAEGTDLTKDFRGEKKNINLIKYIEKNYSLNLFENQKKIKDQLKLFIENKIAKKINHKKISQGDQIDINKKISKFLEKTKTLRLWNVRHLISNLMQMNIYLDPLFFDLLQKTNDHVNDWGGKLFFVYMPEARRYENHLNRFVLRGKFRNKEIILNKVKSMNIDIIDVDKDIFSKNENPLVYFDRTNVHYNKYGYKLIANEIIDKVQNK